MRRTNLDSVLQTSREKARQRKRYIDHGELCIKIEFEKISHLPISIQKKDVLHVLIKKSFLFRFYTLFSIRYNPQPEMQRII